MLGDGAAPCELWVEKSQVYSVTYGAAIDNSFIPAVLYELAKILTWGVINSGGLRKNGSRQFVAQPF